MSHFEERLERDLQEIRHNITELGNFLGEALGNAVTAFLTGDRDLAYATILRDQVVNRRSQQIDTLCHAFVVRYAPSGGPLRFVSSALRISVSLERIGDYAVTVCRETARIEERPSGVIRRDFDLLVQEAQHLLEQSLVAFNTQNAEMAKGIRQSASNVGRAFDDIFDDLVGEGQSKRFAVLDLLAYLLVFSRLSRICDQAKNICEETVFSASGEQKPPKVFKILFVDGPNNCLSQMGELIAARTFGKRAKVMSAGWAPADQLEPLFETFMKRQGLQTGDCDIRVLEPLPELLANQHIVVALDPDTLPHLGKIPYHTVLLVWDLRREIPGTLDTASLERAFHKLSDEIGQLCEVLTGAPLNP